jgi:hypothetical protein
MATLGRKPNQHSAKKGAVDYPKVFSHAGILGNGPPNPDRLPFVLSSNVYQHHYTQGRAAKWIWRSLDAHSSSHGCLSCGSFRANRSRIVGAECANRSEKLFHIGSQSSAGSKSNILCSQDRRISRFAALMGMSDGNEAMNALVNDDVGND